MASTDEEARALDATTAVAQSDEPVERTEEPGSLKRKAEEVSDEGSPKRTRHDGREGRPSRPRRRSPSPHRRDSRSDYMVSSHDRKKPATQEEKKRGRRLFGGVLSTLSQKPSNPQQQRRREIEQRQKERLQKQKEEDEQKRAEKAARLHDIRMSEQIVFEEEVMRNRHSKLFSMAKYLRTKSEPQICYLPWKPTPQQSQEIEQQIKDTNATIEQETESFKAKKERHIRDYGPSKRTPPLAAQPTTDLAGVGTKDSEVTKEADKSPAGRRDQSANQNRGNHHHDESADVVEEADEDMVIY